MTYIEDLLAAVGGHWELVIIACVEILAAVGLFVIFAGRNLKEKKTDGLEIENTFLKALGTQKEEAWILMRRQDMLPVYGAGNLEGLFGISLKMLQRDMAALLNCFADASKGRRIWQQYQEWDGQGTLTKVFEIQGDEWIRLGIHRSKDKAYDFVSFYRITEDHHLIEDYKQRLNEAEEMSQSKTTFLSRMSHEIRTPMNGIIGMLTLAKEKVGSEHPVQQYLEKASDLSDHLLSLINDILDMSRIEAGKVELEKKVFSLRELGDRLYDMFAKNLEARGVRYEVNFEDMTVDYVLGDELRISQIIINFLSNAVKFTKEGEVIVTFRQMMLRGGNVDLMIRVHDTGIGMSSEFINRIFRPFEQESIDTSRQYGGTGLGMAITDQLVRLMGGEIVVESVPGKGSDFSVFLHLPTAAQEECVKMPEQTAVQVEEQEYEDAFENRRILLAEDNEINAMIAVEILQEMGVSVDLAENGQEAVDIFAGHEEGYYDFILMDVQMPVMDGRTAARKIRGLNRKDAGSVLIFALSADAFVEDERLSVESGMNAHYAKPVDFYALRRNVGEFLEKKGQDGR